MKSSFKGELKKYDGKLDFNFPTAFETKFLQTFLFWFVFGPTLSTI